MGYRYYCCTQAHLNPFSVCTVRETFVSWLTPAMDRVTALFPVPHGKVSRDNARTALCAVQKEARERKDDIEELRQLAHTFRESREVGYT